MLAISARGLEKRFGAVPALQGVDLEVPEAGALAVLGPNGAGKSTLLKILAGLAAPSAGHLEVMGRRHSSSNREGARAQVGYAGHATLLYPDLSAKENLAFAGRLYDVPNPEARASVLLADAGLGDVADRPARTFSQGMSRRLSIARALVHAPHLLLLDEPFAGLDGASAGRLVARLRELRENGQTLVVITHDVGLACAVADRAIVLSRGKVVHESTGGSLNVAALEQACAQASDRAEQRR